MYVFILSLRSCTRPPTEKRQNHQVGNFRHSSFLSFIVHFIFRRILFWMHFVWTHTNYTEYIAVIMNALLVLHVVLNALLSYRTCFCCIERTPSRLVVHVVVDVFCYGLFSKSQSGSTQSLHVPDQHKQHNNTAWVPHFHRLCLSHHFTHPTGCSPLRFQESSYGIHLQI